MKYSKVIKSSGLSALMKKETKKKLSSDLQNFLKQTYFKDIPLKQIQEIFEKHGAILLQEDNTPWEGFIFGKSGHTSFEIGDKNSKVSVFYTPFSNTLFVLTWHKMDSGNYEIVGYLS